MSPPLVCSRRPLDLLVCAPRPSLAATTNTQPRPHRSEALRVLGEAFAAAARPSKGGFVREALSAGYPRLAAALEAAFARLQQETRARGAPAAVGPGQLPALLAAAAPFRDAYLAAALGRLQDAVGAAFPGGGRGLPSPADVQKLVAAAHEELRAAGASALLAGQVAGVVGKALQQAAQRAEYMAAAGPDLRALALQPLGGGGGGVGGSGGAGAGATPAQQRNIALASQVQEVHRCVTSAVTLFLSKRAVFCTYSMGSVLISLVLRA